MVSLGGPALGLVMCIEENPSATSRLQWIAFGFAGNNRVNTLVPDLRIAVVTESNVGICSVQKLPSRAKSPDEIEVPAAVKLDEAIGGQSSDPDNRSSAPRSNTTMGFPPGLTRESSRSPEFSTSARNSPN